MSTFRSRRVERCYSQVLNLERPVLRRSLRRDPVTDSIDFMFQVNIALLPNFAVCVPLSASGPRSWL